jgi:uncharacterized repeat protein (TIGR02059 family)
MPSYSLGSKFWEDWLRARTAPWRSSHKAERKESLVERSRSTREWTADKSSRFHQFPPGSDNNDRAFHGLIPLGDDHEHSAEIRLHSAPPVISTDPLHPETWSQPTAPRASTNGRFDIDVSFTGDSTFRTVFERAADRWETIITGDLPDQTLNGRFIDDLLIDASVVSIDGQGGVLGSAGWTDLRLTSTGTSYLGGLPVKGQMQFDSADMAYMQTQGILEDVVLHEMGHVLGIGSLWRSPYNFYFAGPWDRYTNNSANQLRNNSFQYTGTNGNTQYQAYGGSGLTPIADIGGSGSIGSHWRESAFDTELMTPTAENNPPMPISRITIGGLQDMGYTVNLNAADQYTLPGSPGTDDFRGDTSTTGTVAINGPTSGNLETPTDSDWFRMTLNAGTAYTFRQNATTSDLDSLLSLRNASGAELARDDDSGGSSNSLITFTPTTTGTYFLDAGSYNQASSGRYTVSANADATDTPGDTTAPTVTSLSVNGSSLVLTLNETLRSTIPSTSRFRVLVNNVSRSINTTSVDANNRTVTLNLASPVAAGQSVTLAYTDPTSGNDTAGVIEDAAGNDLATFTARSVNNSTPAPTVTSLSVNGSSLVLTLNETLRSTIPSTSRFRVLVNNVSRSINTTSVDANNRTVPLNLASPVAAGQSVTLAYTDPTSGNDTADVIEDAAGNDLATFTARSVNNSTPAATDDFRGDTSTTGTVAINGSTSGNLETPTDSDWFHMTLNAGTVYTFRQNATTPDLDSLLSLRNASGVELARDDDSGDNGNSLFSFTPTTTGTYFLDAGSYNQASSGRYTVSANAQAGGNNWWDGGQFNELWGFNQSSDKDIDAPEAFASWGSPSGGISNVNAAQNKVAVLDSGIRRTHEDLAQNYIGGFDFVDNDSDPSDGNGHGTHCAGTIGAIANSTGVVGANPAAKLLAVKVLGDKGDGSTSGIINGINYAVQQGAKVLSMSIGYGPGVNPGSALGNALAAAGAAGSLSVIAAGNASNDNDIWPTFPASYTDPSIIAVAASNNSDSRATFSNYGSSSVDLYAPGAGILSTGYSSDSSYTYMSGTSMATPLVAGIVSAYWARNPSLSASQVKSRLMQTVDPLLFGRDTVTGGRVNMARMFGLNSSLSSKLDAKTDPLTGASDSTLAGHSSLESQKTSLLPNKLGTHDLSNINSLSASSLSLTESIIVFLAGDNSERSSDARTLDMAIDRGASKYRSFGEFTSMRALSNTIGILSLNENTTPRRALAGLKDMLSRGLISGFEMDAPIVMI